MPLRAATSDPKTFIPKDSKDAFFHLDSTGGIFYTLKNVSVGDEQTRPPTKRWEFPKAVGAHAFLPPPSQIPSQ